VKVPGGGGGRNGQRKKNVQTIDQKEIGSSSSGESIGQGLCWGGRRQKKGGSKICWAGQGLLRKGRRKGRGVKGCKAGRMLPANGQGLPCSQGKLLKSEGKKRVFKRGLMHESLKKQRIIIEEGGKVKKQGNLPAK